ncbi:hypothetical protein HBI54_057710 [Parastagonospora nodorum]|nr:hypothetical protein HBH42_049250 [Parastagonospora nodorum]KAH6049633.1 hypothetical protein HBI54_057710 [Parastagonospora nodorum]KAH6117236.1 hypothetical protein HBI69_102900 [Parastagonospora nodorum]
MRNGHESPGHSTERESHRDIPHSLSCKVSQLMRQYPCTVLWMEHGEDEATYLAIGSIIVQLDEHNLLDINRYHYVRIIVGRGLGSVVPMELWSEADDLVARATLHVTIGRMLCQDDPEFRLAAVPYIVRESMMQTRMKVPNGGVFELSHVLCIDGKERRDLLYHLDV